MNDAMICEKCSNQMQYFRDQSTCGWTCPQCGWGIVTTYHDPIDLDERIYTIIIPPQEATLDAVKSISTIFSVNYIEARKSLMNGSLRASGKAKDIKNKATLLSGCSVVYKIEPEFPYLLDS